MSNAFDKSIHTEQKYNPISALLNRLEETLSTAHAVADLGLNKIDIWIITDICVDKGTLCHIEFTEQ